MNKFYNADCFNIFPLIPSGSVDMILCDLPYGTTACSWDSILPFEPLWKEYWRIIKPNGAIVLTASQPFTSALINSQIERFKYEWIWEKPIATGFIHAKNKPLKAHENICVFSRGSTGHVTQTTNRITYNPQFENGDPYHVKNRKPINSDAGSSFRKNNLETETINDGLRYPRTVKLFKNETGIHPTQKPVALFEYLIKTYTNPGDMVLDNCAGSGTTAVAANNTGRNWICIERDKTYFEAAIKRADHNNLFKPPMEAYR